MTLTFKEYQKQAATTAIYREKDLKVLYPCLGLGGEAGEVLEKVKKQYRDKERNFDDPEFLAGVGKEIGDVLWYCASLAGDLGLDLGDIAAGNLIKLADREKRGKVAGSGDNR